jgi:hypothetical protein
MSQFQNFIAGMSMSISPKVDSLPVAASTSIAKGDVIVESSGFMVVATAANSVKRHCFVAIEAADNSAGANGDIGVLCVGQGQRVTVLTKSIITPGEGVKISGTDGAIAALDEALDDINVRIGFYIGIEPGVYSKDTASPFAEGYTTNSAPEVACAVDDIVVMELE